MLAQLVIPATAPEVCIRLLQIDAEGHALGLNVPRWLVESYWLGDYRPAYQPATPLLLVIRAARLEPQDGANLAP